jgi:hypothetical protein
MTRSLLVAVLALSFSGCGLVFTHGPPRNFKRMDSFECTTSDLGPTLDLAAAAGVITLGALFTALASDGGGQPELGLAVAAFPAAVWVGSGFAGFRKTRRCREALEVSEVLRKYRRATGSDSATGGGR